MGRPKKEDTNDQKQTEVINIPSINDLEWTDYVLGLLHEDEKISGNPTTDGLRRIFEVALNCDMIESSSVITQSPSPENERRATVVHTISYYLKDHKNEESRHRTISGAADVYWGNCDKIYRNHPVAVAETRAEGRALRRALRLRKVVAAEELSKDIDTEHLDENNIGKINTTQINFFDVFGKRLNINIVKLLDKLAIDSKNVYNISYDDAIKTISALSAYQQSNDVPSDIIGYDSNWK